VPRANHQTTDRAEIRRSLIAWFAKAARDLPWRSTRDPYAIFVSELMLQQTQVATVIPYYERWLARFPDFLALAAADESDVLSVWQGLGYYSRARNLHRAARHIVAHHGGLMPKDPEQIRALPGVGRYTAGAVASFAFDLPEPLVDANVARVLARLMNLSDPIDSTAGQRALWNQASELVPAKSPGKFNAALMELGAILCKPREPGCLLCPVQRNCGAHRADTVTTIPQKKPRRKTIDLDEPCAWIQRDQQILLEQQVGTRWRGLWKLPAIDSVPDAPSILSLEYPFTHHRVTLSVFHAAAPKVLRENLAWHKLADLPDVPLAAPHRRAIDQLRTRKQASKTRPSF
jgi:A/G-specific adenine glycosylase